MQNTYKCISCALYDQYELYAIRGTILRLLYEDAVGTEQQINTTIQTLETRDKAEFLVTASGTRIRLDKVLEVRPV